MSAAKKLDRFPEEAYLESALRSGKARRQEVSMKAIGNPDSSLQCRVKHLDHEHVRRLGNILVDSGSLAPIVLFRDPATDTLWLADGFHRHEAHRIAKMKSIMAIVVEGDRTDALKYAAMCNRLATLPRNRDDIRKAIESLLDVEECFLWSDSAMAKHVGCSSPTVARVRFDYCKERELSIPETCVSESGRVFSRKIKPDTLSAYSKGRMPSYVDQYVLFFAKRGIKVGPISRKQHLRGLSSLRAGDAVFTWTNLEDQADLPHAIGRVLLASAATPDARRKVVLRPDGKGNAEITSLASEKFGVEFMTHEELAEGLKLRR